MTVERTACQRSVLHKKCYSNDKIKKNEMGGACSMYGRKEPQTGFGGEV
jgi:hypothetical protein